MPYAGGTMKHLIKLNRTERNGTFLTVCGLTLALNPFGNCFSPAICLNAHKGGGKRHVYQYKGQPTVGYTAKAILTLRSNISLETRVYWRGGLRFDWNSGHLARWFGKFHDTDFGGYCQWRNHMDL